jgi:hypothetical protein
MWLLLGVIGVIIPMIISHYVEMLLQNVTRKFLNKTLLTKFLSKTSSTQMTKEVSKDTVLSN